MRGTTRGSRRVGLLAGIAAAAVGLAACGGGTSHSTSALSAQEKAAAANPNLDLGTPIHHTRAPDFRLTDQFGQKISLSAFRGKVVLLAFTDSECTTICPLTTSAMTEARDLLGKAGDKVQLLGIDANPSAIRQSNVMAYSRAHAMVNQWDFLTGSLAQLHRVWKAYHIYVQIVKGDVDHTPALYVIDTKGQERKLYLTTMSYTSVGQSAEVLAREASQLLPGHPRLRREESLASIGGTTPATKVTVPAVTGSKKITLGPGRPRLVMFFDTWLDETSPLRADLLGMNRYVADEKSGRLPGLVALDEGVTEPATTTARRYLGGLGSPLRYPVGVDTTGRIADGYGVQDQPWFDLVSASGKVLWKHDGWLPEKTLESEVRQHAS